MAPFVQPEPDGGRHRGLSLGALWDACPDFELMAVSAVVVLVLLLTGAALLQADGADVRGSSVMSDIAINVENISKKYEIGAAQRATTRCATRSCTASARWSRQTDPRPGAREEFLGAEGCVVRGPAGRGRRHHREERRRQEHAPQDPVAHHGADDRPRPRFAAAWRRCWRSAPASTPS